MSDPLSRMDARELRKLMLDLRAHARMRLRLRSRSIDLADDFAQIAILKAKSTRVYNPKNGTYLEFLTSIIDGTIYHHYRSRGHTDIVFGQEHAFINFTDSAFSPEEELSYLQQEKDMLAYIEMRSQKCHRVAVWMVKGGVRTPAKLSELTGMPVDKIYGHIRHLKSIVQKWKEISNQTSPKHISDDRIKGRE